MITVTIGVCAALAVFFGWWWQVYTPSKISWREGVHQGFKVKLADGLVLQHDDGETVWASRGYSIYRSDKGSDFHKVARVRPPIGEPYGGYLSALRRMFGYQELMELLPLDKDKLLVFSGGYANVVHLGTNTTKRTLKLRYFGRGKGRGMMAFGLCEDQEGSLYFAEYVTESGERPTGVWKSSDSGLTWSIVYEFAPGAIRHIHAVQCDPEDGAIWIGTGDRDEHCFIGRSTDGGQTFEWIGQGKQIHRTCSFVFFSGAVLWPMDADFEQNYVLRWIRSGQLGAGEVTTGAQLPDASYYASRISDHAALVGVAQSAAQVWVVSAEAEAEKWLEWEVPATPPKRGPSPGVRLARGENHSGPIHVNPLRTNQHEAVIYRIERNQLPKAQASSQGRARE